MNNKSVPHKSAVSGSKPIQQEFNFHAVQLEPELQMEAATFTPHQRRMLASVYERWAHQLRVTAKVLEKDLAPRPRGEVMWLPAKKLARN